MPLEQVSIDHILDLQRDEQASKELEAERKRRAMLERGMSVTDRFDDMS